MPEPTPKSFRALPIVRLLGVFGVVGVGVASALVWSARWFWLGEIAASFSWHLGLLALTGAALLLIMRSWRLALVLFLLGLLHAGPELSLYFPDPGAGPNSVDTKGEPLEILSVANCNLLWSNQEYAGFRTWLKTHNPDLVVCEEISPGWRTVLEGLREYPNRLISPRPSEWCKETWGTAIISRRPFASKRLLMQSMTWGRPAMEVTVDCLGKGLTIRGIHTARAGKAWRLKMRDTAIHGLQEQRWDEFGILMGDLNLTSTSPVFASLLSATGLRDSRRGFGRQPTWTTDRMIPGLSLAIDHILVGDGFRVIDRSTSKIPGSDHLAVHARLTSSD